MGNQLLNTLESSLQTVTAEFEKCIKLVSERKNSRQHENLNAINKVISSLTASKAELSNLINTIKENESNESAGFTKTDEQVICNEAQEEFMANRLTALAQRGLSIGSRCWYNIEKAHSRVSGEIIGFTKTGKVRIRHFTGRIYAAPMVRVCAI